MGPLISLGLLRCSGRSAGRRATAGDDGGGCSPLRRRLALAVLVVCTILAGGGCSRRAVHLPTPDQVLPPPSVAPSAPPTAPTRVVPEPAEPYHYPPYRYCVEGSSLHLVAAGFSLAGHPSAKADYWVVMGDPVTVKIHFAQAVASSRDVLRQVLEDKKTTAWRSAR